MVNVVDMQPHNPPPPLLLADSTSFPHMSRQADRQIKRVIVYDLLGPPARAIAVVSWCKSGCLAIHLFDLNSILTILDGYSRTDTPSFHKACRWRRVPPEFLTLFRQPCLLLWRTHSVELPVQGRDK